jgi:hypothetical protein
MEAKTVHYKEFIKITNEYHELQAKAGETCALLYDAHLFRDRLQTATDTDAAALELAKADNAKRIDFLREELVSIGGLISALWVKADPHARAPEIFPL